MISPPTGLLHVATIQKGLQPRPSSRTAERLRKNIKSAHYKAVIRSVFFFFTFTYTTWEYETDTHLMKLQRLYNKVYRAMKILTSSQQSVNCR